MRRLFALGGPLVLWGGLLGACSKDNAAVPLGGECDFASDCAPGLVCVEQRNKSRICTDDLTGVAGEPPGQGEEGDGGEGEGGAGEGGMTDGPPVGPDTGTDAGSVTDTGVDTGQPVDAAGDG